MPEALFERPGRPIHSATEDGGLSEKILYSSIAPEGYRSLLVFTGFFTCNPCLISNAETIRRETYVTVYENKVETNNPVQCCCCMYDRVQVLYFDRDEFTFMGKAECCSPSFTHCSPCPTYFDGCGEGLVLYGADMCSTKQSCSHGFSGLCFCCTWKMLYPLNNAEEVKAVIRLARKKAFDNASRHRSLAVPLTQHARDSFRLESLSHMNQPDRDENGPRDEEETPSGEGPRPESMQGQNRKGNFVTATPYAPNSPYAPAAADMRRM